MRTSGITYPWHIYNVPQDNFFRVSYPSDCALSCLNKPPFSPSSIVLGLPAWALKSPERLAWLIGSIDGYSSYRIAKYCISQVLSVYDWHVRYYYSYMVMWSQSSNLYEYNDKMLERKYHNRYCQTRINYISDVV